jgi:HEAT repeat protein
VAGEVPWLDGLFRDADPGVRAALASLYGSNGRDDVAEPILASLLDGDAAAERVAGLQAMRRLGRTMPAGIAHHLLTDEAPEVRAAALDALAEVGHVDEVLDPTLALLDDGTAIVRDAAARALAGLDRAPDALFVVLAAGSPRAQDAARAAMQGHAPEVRDRVIAWSIGRLDRAADLRRARLATEARLATDGQGPGDGHATGRSRPILDFLLAVLADRERRAVALALRAMGILGAPEANGVIRRCLRSPDPETRAQAIEALDSIGDHRLSGALVRLLELDSGAPQASAAPVARLVDDDDPWIARLAQRADDGRMDVPDTSRTLADLDRMLVLRRVPLFERLDPEDLQRIALHAVEHLYPPGEPLVREGDVGDELIVLVDGSVRVVKAEPDGSERLIRRYEPGDHIGELAILREAPRAATVIAEGDGVRGLVIGGDGLRAILRERPDAAMAMLATLAERISRQ